MGRCIPAENALHRWGPLWEILGFSQLKCRGFVDGGSIAAGGGIDCFDNYGRAGGGYTSRVFITTHYYKFERRHISDKEADILSDLLLGTTLTQQETNK